MPEETTAEKLLPSLIIRQANIFEYKSIRELLPNADDDQLQKELKWIGEQDSSNAEYVKYEMEKEGWL